MFTDENAFGILVSHFRLEDEEYGLERAEFVKRFELFRQVVRDALRDVPLGAGVRAIDFGHAVYVEIAEGDQSTSPIGWARKVREQLAERGFDSAAFVTHGSRWVDEAAETFVSTEHVGDAGLLTISNPSEPLRRAFFADAASHDAGAAAESESTDVESRSWGPGLYLDTEAAEALALAPKNAPTILSASGAGFYRVGR
jgi:hypothetical protein